MFETLKKIGVPTAIAVAIVVMVMAVPFLFKIDERYAKQAHLEAEVLRLEKRNQELTVELAQNAGFQSAMIALIQQGRVPAPSVVAAVPTPAQIVAAPSLDNLPATNAGAASAPPIRKVEKLRNWGEISEAVTRQQQRLMKD